MQPPGSPISGVEHQITKAETPVYFRLELAGAAQCGVRRSRASDGGTGGPGGATHVSRETAI
ncbi:hypothetical protein M707_23640 [Arthrobacter sp. AK-YN10]|nr:hypothetical protein M707_23640 [Arthrobacter sp. AK-YN10]